MVHSAGDRLVDVALGRYLGTGIPGARYVEVQSNSHFPWYDDPEAVADEICAFIRTAETTETDTALLTVLAVEPVGTIDAERFARDVGRLRGHIMATDGTPLLAFFDSPRRAVRCALAMCCTGAGGGRARAGLHTGEVVLGGTDPGGPTVEAAAELARSSAPGEVLVTTIVRELLAGSGIELLAWGQVGQRLAHKVAAL